MALTIGPRDRLKLQWGAGIRNDGWGMHLPPAPRPWPGIHTMKRQLPVS